MIRLNSQPEPDDRPDLTPLIDVVFLVVTFFLFAFLLMVPADILGVSLPNLQSAETDARTDIIAITLTAEGELRLDRQPTTIDQLAASISTRRAEAANAPIIIAADTAAPSGSLMQVVDTLVGAGITDFSLLATPTAPSTAEPTNQP